MPSPRFHIEMCVKGLSFEVWVTRPNTCVFRIPKSLLQCEESRELATLIASDAVTDVQLENGFDDVVGHGEAKVIDV